MNPTNPAPDSDPSLRELLRDAMPPADLPPRFREAVWNRIALGERHEPAIPGMSSWLDRLVGVILRPRVALAVGVIVLAVSSLLGFVAASEEARRVSRDTYLTVVTPFAKGHQS